MLVDTRICPEETIDESEKVLGIARDSWAGKGKFIVARDSWDDLEGLPLTAPIKAHLGKD